MPLDPFALQPGHSFTPAALVITDEEARAYLQAVGDATALYEGDAAPLPPLLLIAQGIRALMNELDVRPGTVHGAQEVESVRPAASGQPLRYEAAVSRASTRQGIRFLVVDVTVHDAAGPVCRGRTTLLIPQAVAGIAQAG